MSRVGEQFTQQVVEQGENAITPQLVEQIQSEPGGLVPVLTEPPSCGSFLYNKVEEGRGKREDIVLIDVICYAKALVDWEESVTFANRLWK